MNTTPTGQAPTSPLTDEQRVPRYFIQTEFLRCLGARDPQLLFIELRTELRMVGGCQGPRRIEDLMQVEDGPERLSPYLLTVDDRTVEETLKFFVTIKTARAA